MDPCSKLLRFIISENCVRLSDPPMIHPELSAQAFQPEGKIGPGRSGVDEYELIPAGEKQSLVADDTVIFCSPNCLLSSEPFGSASMTCIFLDTLPNCIRIGDTVVACYRSVRFTERYTPYEHRSLRPYPGGEDMYSVQHQYQDRNDGTVNENRWCPGRSARATR